MEWSINMIMNDQEKVRDLYIKKDTLSIRVDLHKKYSVNTYGWGNWVFEQYEFMDNFNILEIGCGTADIWKNKSNKISENINIILTDISELMLKKAEENLSSNNKFSYKIMDIQDIPFPDNSFDIIIANHMLYHVPDLTKALSEVNRTLKPNGIFYATTIGNDHLKDLQDIYRKYEDKVNFSYSDQLTFTL